MIPGSAWAVVEEDRPNRPELPLAVTSVAEPAGVTTTAEPSMAFTENQPWQDFVVHFTISLPFTALYSFASVMALDGVIQGTMPPTLRDADTWVIIGLAAGSSLAIALGSTGRVPDQSRPRLEPAAATGPGPSRREPEAFRCELVRVTY
jgi:hypothetical protein